jgi:hypothetical protein
MTKSRGAEWILSQVLPPDRAASTVGDWMEDATQRGNIWFWSCVLQTAVLSVWRDLTEKPLTMAGIGLLGFARNSLAVIGIALAADTILRSHYRSLIFTPPSSWLIGLTVYVLSSWWYFQTGRWTARRSPSHELAGCVAVSLVGWLAVVAELTVIPGATVHYVIFYILPPGLIHDISLLAGALSLRRRQLHPVG